MKGEVNGFEYTSFFGDEILVFDPEKYVLSSIFDTIRKKNTTNETDTITGFLDTSVLLGLPIYLKTEGETYDGYNPKTFSDILNNHLYKKDDVSALEKAAVSCFVSFYENLIYLFGKDKHTGRPNSKLTICDAVASELKDAILTGQTAKEDKKAYHQKRQWNRNVGYLIRTAEIMSKLDNIQISAFQTIIASQQNKIDELKQRKKRLKVTSECLSRYFKNVLAARMSAQDFRTKINYRIDDVVKDTKDYEILANAAFYSMDKRVSVALLTADVDYSEMCEEITHTKDDFLLDFFKYQRFFADAKIKIHIYRKKEEVAECGLIFRKDKRLSYKKGTFSATTPSETEN